MTRIAENLSSTILLNDGVSMPMFGLGTSRSSSGKGADCEKAVLTALENGYRLVDTAQAYGNEADVGRAVRKSGIERQEVFVVSKLHDDFHDAASCTESVKQSLERMGLDYIDLFLIHSPGGGNLVETFNTLQHLKSQGLIRSVGVSNFDIHHLEGLKQAGCPIPSVNQFELHPWLRREELVHYCLENKITVMGYSPLVKGHKMDDHTVGNIASRLGKTVAQVLIRWSVQKGFITIPKTCKPKRTLFNAQVFDFCLSEEDMKLMSMFPSYMCAWNPIVLPFDG